MGECRACAHWKPILTKNPRTIRAEWTPAQRREWLSGGNPPRPENLTLDVKVYRGYGSCDLAEYGENAEYDNPAPTAPIIYGDSEGYAAWLQTRSTFGCNQHTPKEAPTP